MFFVEHAFIMLLKFLSVICAFLSPLLLDALTVNFDESAVPRQDTKIGRFAAWLINAEDPKVVGLGISMMLVLNLLFIMLIESQYKWRINKLTTRIKTCLQMVTYSKILQLPMAPNKNVADPLSIMGADIDQVNNFIISFNQSWSSVLRLTYALFMLWIRVIANIFVLCN